MSAPSTRLLKFCELREIQKAALGRDQWIMVIERPKQVNPLLVPPRIGL